VAGKLQVGIIGTGGIARNCHMPAWNKHPNCEIIAVCDANEQALNTAAEQFGVKYKFTDYKKMLTMEEIDVVDICTPNYLHAEPAILALNSGKHVMVEKPMAMNAAEGEAMCEAARKAGKKLMVALNCRWGAEAQALKRFVDAGEIGEIYYARVQALRRRGIPGWGVFTQKDKQGGGPLIDIGVHVLDLTLWLMGHPKPIAASGLCYTKFGTRPGLVGLFGKWDHTNYTVEDFAVGLVRFDNGASLVIEASFAANIEKDVFNTALLGTEGGCEWNPIKIFKEEHQTLLDVTPVFLPKINTYEAEIFNFADSILNDTPTPVPGEEGLMVTKIIDAIYKSAEEGKEVPIK
jgi:predicted dehydrogenase